MKRLLTSGALLLCSLFAAFAQYSGSGSGTTSDPYRVFDAYELNQLRNFLNQSGVVFKLMNNIDLAEWITNNNPGQGWEPIGTSSTPFKGVLDGNGKKLTGFSINRSSTDYVGLFAYISDATIQNLTIEGPVTGKTYVGGFAGKANNSCTLTGLTHNGATTGTGYVGGIAGSYSGYISDLIVTGNVNGSADCVGGAFGYIIGTSYTVSDITVSGDVVNSSSSSKYVGGIAGGTYNPMSDVSYTGSVSGGNYVGGLVGYCGAAISNATINAGTISGKENVGGVVGIKTNVNITTVHVSGTVTGTTMVGGICGKSAGGTLTDCYSYCDVTGTGNYVGGVLGKGYPEMTGCSSFGNISGSSYVGGVIGGFEYDYEAPHFANYLETVEYPIPALTKQLTVSNCFAVGNVTASGNYAGGVCGYNDKCFSWAKYLYASESYKYEPIITYVTLSDSYFCGDVEGNNYVGGVVGFGNNINVLRNYSNGTVKGAAYVGGIIGSIQANANTMLYYNYNSSTPSTPASGQYFSPKSSLKSNMAIVTSVVATSNVARIYGNKESTGVTVGTNGSTEDNRALYDGRLVISGVTQDVVDSPENGVNNGIGYFKLMGSYVGHGWNFNSDWTNLETESFPYKPWQAAPPKITSDLVSGDASISGQSLNNGTVYITIGKNAETSVDCSGNNWTLSGINPLKSGELVTMYTVATGKQNSYRTRSTVGYPGSGTEEDPWRVYTAEDIQGVYKAGYYKQMNDINLTSWINANSPSKGWVPVGYSGADPIVYDGDNHKVTGLWINTTDNYTGLFSSFSKGTIRNLTIEAGLKGVKGGTYTGLLIGRFVNGTIENISATGKVQGTDKVGGIVGYTIKCNFNQLSFSGQVTSSGVAGGISSVSSGGTSTNCVVTESTINGGNGHIGGLFAQAGGTISHCKVTGTTTTRTGTNSGYIAGGLVGFFLSGSISQCFADVTVSSSSSATTAAGLVAYNEGTISQCSSAGSVTVSGTDSRAGGLVGYNAETGKVENCYSTATATAEQYAAGLVAYNFGKVDKCYASGNVSATYYAAGLVGYNDGENAEVTNSVALNTIVEVSDQSGWSIRVIGGYKNGAPDPDESNYAWKDMQLSINGVPKIVSDNILNGQSLTTAQTKSQDTYESLGWDFTDIWGIGTGYPYLQYFATAAPVVTKGDLDGDGSIDVADIVLIIDVIAQLRTDENMVAAADVNGDGDVDVADIVSCIDLMAAQTTASPAMASLRAAAIDYLTAVRQDNQVELSLNNQNQYTAFQMTVTLPEGMMLRSATLDELRGESHQLLVRQLNSQDYLIMGLSMDKDVLSGNAGRLLTLTTEGDANGEICFSNVLFATPDAETFHLNALSVPTSTTGIHTVAFDSSDSEIFDLQGRKVNGNAKSGLYIVNGKKVVVK